MLACATLGGCGLDSGKPSASARRKVAQPSLPKPQLPHCDFPTFAKPIVTHTIRRGAGVGWRLAYLPPSGKPVASGHTSSVAILEESPTLPAQPVAAGRSIVVAGKRVSLARAGTGDSLATWKTAHARYLMLANGDRAATLKEFIRCLP
jgi:hypothetical protein